MAALALWTCEYVTEASSTSILNGKYLKHCGLLSV